MPRSDTPEDQEGFDFEPWEFDPGFFKALDATDGYDEGGVAVFRLRRRDGSDGVKYLHLFNSHNGYYSHGFEMEHSGVKLREGWL